MNDTNPLPPCAEFEHEIVELEEGLLSPDTARAVRGHLDACPRCRAWHASWTALDASLAATLPRPELPPDFTARLMARIATETRRAPVAARRGAAEHEYELASRTLRAAYRRNAIALLAAAAVVALSTMFALPWITASFEGVARVLEPSQRMLASLGAVAAIVFATLGWAATRDVLPLPRWLR